MAAAVSCFAVLGHDRPNPWALPEEAPEPVADGGLDAIAQVSKEASDPEPSQAHADATPVEHSLGAAGAAHDGSFERECSEVSAQLAADVSAVQGRAEMEHALERLCEWRDSGRLEAAVQHVSFDALSDDGLQRVMATVATAELSYASCLALMRSAMLGRVLALEQPASRSLFAMLQATVERHPKVVVDGLLAPVFAQEAIGPAQAEVVSRLLRDVLPVPFALHFLDVVLSPTAPGGRWGDLQVGILQTALARKLPLTAAIVLALLEHARASSGRLKGSLKFAKMVLVLVQKYGAEIAPHAQLVVQIAQASETFMKAPLTKAANAAARQHGSQQGTA